MKDTFKISTKYWDSLVEKEQNFFRYYAAGFGVRKCKRIITLSNIVFPDWEDIVEFSHYDKNAMTGCHWVVFDKNKAKIGIITKTEYAYESIDIVHKGKLCKVWSNDTSKNPTKVCHYLRDSINN